MKIDRLYTLSQFVDLIWQYDTIEDSKRLDLIFSYNEFLKQPLKKEMFVNELEKPIKPIGYDNWKNGNGGADGVACVRYNGNLKAWQEAENKVIFENVEIIKNKWIDFNIIINEEHQILEKYENLRLVNNKKNWLDLGKIKTLSDLAEKTNGQLKLKNVEI